MTLDDVYGPEHDRFPLEQECIAAPPPLDWGEAMPPQPAATRRDLDAAIEAALMDRATSASAGAARCPRRWRGAPAA